MVKYYDEKLFDEILRDKPDQKEVTDSVMAHLKSDFQMALNLGFLPEQFHFMVSVLCLNNIVTEYQLHEAGQTILKRAKEEAKDDSQQ